MTLESMWACDENYTFPVCIELVMQFCGRWHTLEYSSLHSDSGLLSNIAPWIPSRWSKQECCCDLNVCIGMKLGFRVARYVYRMPLLIQSLNMYATGCWAWKNIRINLSYLPTHRAHIPVTDCEQSGRHHIQSNCCASTSSFFPTGLNDAFPLILRSAVGYLVIIGNSRVTCSA